MGGHAPWWSYWSAGITNTIGPAMANEALKYIQLSRSDMRYAKRIFYTIFMGSENRHDPSCWLMKLDHGIFMCLLTKWFMSSYLCFKHLLGSAPVLRHSKHTSLCFDLMNMVTVVAALRETIIASFWFTRSSLLSPFFYN
ncbi:hypothetical protein HanPI659440_Chr09g0333631 [Helianthus annuus]|nr:hypothetical protein HanPI659440_Chr09g0333631 [Helianthus annuus]